MRPLHAALASSILLLACEPTASKPAPAAGSAAAAAPKAQGSGTATETTPTASAEVKPAAAPAPAAASAAVASGPSAAPTLEEWGNAKEVRVTGSTDLGCETKMVREWLRVICVPKHHKNAKLLKVNFVGDAPKGGSVSFEEGVKLQLIAPIAKGATLRAKFEWLEEPHTLEVTHPEGGFGTTVGGFSGMTARPGEDLWGTASAVVLTGSTPLGCDVKAIEGWLRLHCGKSGKLSGAPVAATITAGEKTGATKLTVREGDVIQLTTPFEAGTSLEAEFQWKDTKRTLKVDWPAGSADRPVRVGRFSGFSDKPTAEEFKKAKEVNVAGSTKLKCQTKLIEEWFQAICIGSTPSGSPVAIQQPVGAKAEDTTLYAKKGIMSLTTKIEPGTPFAAEFKWTDKAHTLKIDWPKDKPAPKAFGKFDPAP